MLTGFFIYGRWHYLEPALCVCLCFFLIKYHNVVKMGHDILIISFLIIIFATVNLFYTHIQQLILTN